MAGYQPSHAPRIQGPGGPSELRWANRLRRPPPGAPVSMYCSHLPDILRATALKDSLVRQVQDIAPAARRSVSEATARIRAAHQMLTLGAGAPVHRRPMAIMKSTGLPRCSSQSNAGRGRDSPPSEQGPIVQDQVGVALRSNTDEISITSQSLPQPQEPVIVRVAHHGPSRLSCAKRVKGVSSSICRLYGTMNVRDAT